MRVSTNKLLLLDPKGLEESQSHRWIKSDHITPISLKFTGTNLEALSLAKECNEKVIVSKLQ